MVFFSAKLHWFDGLAIELIEIRLKFYTFRDLNVSFYFLLHNGKKVAFISLVINNCIPPLRHFFAVHELQNLFMKAL